MAKYRPLEKLKKRSLNYRGALFILFIVSTPRARIIYVLDRGLIINELN